MKKVETLTYGSLEIGDDEMVCTTLLVSKDKAKESEISGKIIKKDEESVVVIIKQNDYKDFSLNHGIFII